MYSTCCIILKKKHNPKDKPLLPEGWLFLSCDQIIY